MRYIEFIMRDKSLNFTVNEDKAKLILESNNQMIMLTDESGEWTGKIVNKSEIIGTKIDVDETRREYNKENEKLGVEGKTMDSLSPEERKKLIESFKPDFLKNIDRQQEL